MKKERKDKKQSGKSINNIRRKKVKKEMNKKKMTNTHIKKETRRG